MGRSRYKIYDSQYPHFLTMTVVDWLPIFSNREVTDIILDSLRYLQEEKKAKLYAYVIMENHLHCVVQSDELTKVIQSFKSYTARAIIDYFTERKNAGILRKLRQNKLSHKTESEYQVWQEGSHPVEITTDEMMHQKIEYIHNNPVQRGYVEEASYWRYSNAQNYESKQGLVNVEMEW
ncbi:MAG: transposase [Ignavibacteriales bacterium]|nr:transposase [Ignavibacteriales bacterium]